MATILTPDPYTTTTALSGAGHSTNIFSSAAATGIMSEPNGGLQVATNFAAGFNLRAEHVQPHEAVRTAQEGSRETLDFMDDAFANKSEASWLAIPGVSARVTVLKAGTSILWQWSMFASAWRWNYDLNESRESFPIYLRAYVKSPGGPPVPVAHTFRAFPVTVQLRQTEQHVFAYEDRGTQHYDMAHLQKSAPAGRHELSFHVYMEEFYRANVILRPISGTDRSAAHYLAQRLSPGIRNARGVAFYRGP